MEYTKTIELTWDQIDRFVVAELQEAYDMNKNYDVDEVGIPGLPEALLTVLEYFMAPSEFDQWKNTRVVSNHE